MSLTVLFLASNPTHTARLQVDKECRAIDQALLKARDRFTLINHGAVRVEDFPELLMRHRPQMLHFSGHGIQPNQIALEDSAGHVRPVPLEVLSTWFAALRDDLRCVLLNACDSEEQARAIAAHVDVVIGMSQAISDDAALAFSAAFYQAIGYGRDLQTAFDLACAALHALGTDEHNTPRLIALRTAPAQIVLAPPGESLAPVAPPLQSEAPGEPPYMGMRYFDTADAALFFGREALTRELAARLAAEPFLAVVGASGSGKSSLARAGLVPLWQSGIEFPGGLLSGAVHVITPTAHPLESLAASLTRDSESVTATATLIDDLAQDPRSLHLFVRKLLSRTGESHLLLVVDQFEETFTLCKDPAQRKAFIENLVAVTSDASAPLRIILTLRADFYQHCAEYDGLRQALQQHQSYIGAMTPAELRHAIESPALAASWNFQPGLVDLILQDVGQEPGALPLLSHALLETWRRRQGHTLTLSGYAAAGGVRKAIAQTAENVYAQLSPADQTIARQIFLRLTELGEGVQDTRRRATLAELALAPAQQSALEAVLQTLADARLITTAQDSAEVAHEALIREWPTLRRWLDEDRAGLLIHRHLTQSAEEWQRRNRDPGELYRGARLTQVEDWLKHQTSRLSPLETAFLQAARDTLKRERRAARLRWATLAAAAGLVLLTIVLAATGQINALIYRPLDMENYWVTIPSGAFQMGNPDGAANERPVHTVTLDAFEIGRYEVTNHQYSQCVRADVCGTPGNSRYTLPKYEQHPVTDVNWSDADTFCRWVGGRLPTEAEWEKAARGGLQGKRYPWGDAEPVCTPGAENGAQFDACQPQDTAAVGRFAPNKYGLFDMVGNVWEWTADWYGESYYQSSPNQNPTGPQSGVSRVVRSGSWVISPGARRVAFRYTYSPVSRVSYLGFRCVATLKSPE